MPPHKSTPLSPEIQSIIQGAASCGVELEDVSIHVDYDTEMLETFTSTVAIQGAPTITVEGSAGGQAAEVRLYPSPYGDSWKHDLGWWHMAGVNLAEKLQAVPKLPTKQPQGWDAAQFPTAAKHAAEAMAGSLSGASTAFQHLGKAAKQAAEIMAKANTKHEKTPAETSLVAWVGARLKKQAEEAGLELWAFEWTIQAHRVVFTATNRTLGDFPSQVASTTETTTVRRDRIAKVAAMEGTPGTHQDLVNIAVEVVDALVTAAKVKLGTKPKDDSPWSGLTFKGPGKPTPMEYAFADALRHRVVTKDPKLVIHELRLGTYRLVVVVDHVPSGLRRAFTVRRERLAKAYKGGPYAGGPGNNGWIGAASTLANATAETILDYFAVAVLAAAAASNPLIAPPVHPSCQTFQEVQGSWSDVAEGSAPKYTQVKAGKADTLPVLGWVEDPSKSGNPLEQGLAEALAKKVKAGKVKGDKGLVKWAEAVLGEKSGHAASALAKLEALAKGKPKGKRSTRQRTQAAAVAAGDLVLRWGKGKAMSVDDLAGILGAEGAAT